MLWCWLMALLGVLLLRPAHFLVFVALLAAFNLPVLVLLLRATTRPAAFARVPSLGALAFGQTSVVAAGLCALVFEDQGAVLAGLLISASFVPLLRMQYPLAPIAVGAVAACYLPALAWGVAAGRVGTPTAVVYGFAWVTGAVCALLAARSLEGEERRAFEGGRQSRALGERLAAQALLLGAANEALRARNAGLERKVGALQRADALQPDDAAVPSDAGRVPTRAPDPAALPEGGVEVESPPEETAMLPPRADPAPTDATPERPAPSTASIAFVAALETAADARLGDETLDVAALATAVAMSRRTLTERMRGLSMDPPGLWLRHRRLDAAEAMLRRGDFATVGEVAAAVGMSRAYFTRAYRARTGVAPGSDRRR